MTINLAAVVRGFTPQPDLCVEQRAQPKPGPGQVLVRMRYSPINPSDFNLVRGTYNESLKPLIWNQGAEPLAYDAARTRLAKNPPYVLGGEGSGTVVASGGGLLAWRLRGKRVAVASGLGADEGTWQQYLCVDAKRCLPMPDSVSDEQAAMTFVNPLTAYILVREILRVQPGQWLLITAAGSMLGQGAIRMARKYGYKTIAVVRSRAGAEQLAQLGATATVALESEDLIQAVYRITGGRGVQCAMDCVGGDTAVSVIRSLAAAGRLVLYGTLTPEPMTLPSRHLMMPVATVSGFFLPGWLAQHGPLKLLGVLRATRQLIAEGYFDTEIAAKFPLTQIHEALAAAAPGGKKILLDLGSV